MKITNLVLLNIRIFNNTAFQFCSNINLICGHNASGKTTVLEAIHLLVSGRSNRTSSELECVSFKEDEGVLKGVFEDQKTQKSAILLISKYYKKMSIDGVKIDKLSNYVGFAHVVSFGSQDISGVGSSPASRRKMFDSFFCQISPEYLKLLKNYNDLVKEKNATLKKEALSRKDHDLLDVLDDKLFSLQQDIESRRLYFIELINKQLNKVHYYVSDNDEQCQISLVQSIPSTKTKEEYLAYRSEDLMYKTNTHGPHRDDYLFTINNKNALKYGSQGQRKTMVFSLKMAFAEVMKDIIKDDPIILLDDVFGELDSTRQNNIITLLNNQAQVFITTPSLADMDEKLVQKANIIYLDRRDDDGSR